MTEDVILEVTADFVRSSKTNLKLALQVERAMPYVREHFVRAVLEAVEEYFPRSDWSIERLATRNVMANRAGLVLRRKLWGTNRSDPAIWLCTDEPCWKAVWIGLYFHGQSSQKVQPVEQMVTPLTRGGFDFVDSKEEPGVWKHLDADLQDWSGERFLTRILEEGPGRIASEISAELKEIDEFVGSLD